MSQKVDRVGRMAAAITSLVLCALLLNLWVLNAGAEEHRETIPKVRFSQYGFLQPKQNWLEKAAGLISLSTSTGLAVPAVEIEHDLESVNRRGKAVAFINLEKLYLIDKTGRIIAPADSCPHYDLPIISGSGFLVDEKQKKLVDDGAQNALALLREIQKKSQLKPLLSEIKVKDSEIIAYFSFGKVIPVIFGQGGWKQKIDNLIAYHIQLGGGDLTRQAAYLDLRIEDRIVVKKNV